MSCYGTDAAALPTSYPITDTIPVVTVVTPGNHICV